MADIDTVRTAVAIVAAAVGVVLLIIVLVIIGAFRERRLMAVLEHQGDRIREIETDMDTSTKYGGQFDTLEDLLKPYKKHLLQSAFDLQSRLKQQIEPPKGKEPFLYDFCYCRSKDAQNTRDRDYAIHSTVYMFAEFLAWMQVIRHKIVFVTGSHDAEILNTLLEAIRFQMTGESPIQGKLEGAACTKNDESFDVHHHIMQLYIVDIRSIGNAMLLSGDSEDELLRPITVDVFQQRMAVVTEFAQSSDGVAEASSSVHEDEAFRKILAPLYSSIYELAKYNRSDAPRRRLAIIQVLLCKLIDILDAAVPWDYPPKFDSHEEPRYIQRDFRMTPMVKYLSNIQRDYLQGSLLFASDPNLSFPGFREDLAEKTQDERDEMLWQGACPPIEKRRRDEAWHKRHNMQAKQQAVGESASANRLRQRERGLMLMQRQRMLAGVPPRGASISAAAFASRAVTMPGVGAGAGSSSGAERSQQQQLQQQAARESVYPPPRLTSEQALRKGVVAANLARALRPSHSITGRSGRIVGPSSTLLIEEPRGAAWRREHLARVADIDGIGSVATHPDAADVMVATVSADPLTLRAAVNAIARACPRATVEEASHVPGLPGAVAEAAQLPGFVPCGT